MPLVRLEPPSSSLAEQGYSAARGTDSGIVTDAGQADDSEQDGRRCFSMRVVKENRKLGSFERLKEESVEDVDGPPEPDELGADARVELGDAVEGVDCGARASRNWRKAVETAGLPSQQIQLSAWTDLPEGCATTKGVPLVGKMA
jgi:hypothetical protein